MKIKDIIIESILWTALILAAIYAWNYLNTVPKVEEPIVSPASDYVAFDPLENVDDSLAMIMQELRCK